MEQWIYFLNTSEIPHDATAPGLSEARHRLDIDRMSHAEREAYYRHLDNVVILQDNISTARGEGKLEGRAEGLEQGRAEGRAEGVASVARSMKAKGMDASTISELTGIDIDEIRKL